MKRLLFFLAVLITSCNIHLVPQRNDAVLVKVLQAQKTTDSVYDAMIAGNKDYTSNVAGYDLIQSEITDLSITEATRNKIIASQVQILQTHFTYYRNQHQTKGTLNNAELSTYKNDLDAFWLPIFNSENAIK